MPDTGVTVLKSMAPPLGQTRPASEQVTVSFFNDPKLHISRPVLKRCFAEGVMLMQGKTENDRVRPCAYPILGGKQWVVHLVQYPGRSDPLMEGGEAAEA